VKDRGEDEEAPRYKWVVLIVSLLAFVAFAYGFQIAPPLIPYILREFGISNTQAGLLMSFVLIPGILLSLPVILIIDRYGAKYIVLLSLLSTILGSALSGIADSYLTILAGRFTLGVGGAIIMTATPTIISQWFTKKELGKAMGIFSVNMPLATIVALPTASSFSQTFGWRFLFYVSTVLGAVITVAFAIAFREGPLGKEKKAIGLRQAFSSVEIWKSGVIWLFFQASMLSFVTWLPTLLIKFQNVPILQAGLMTSLLSWTALIFVPLYGFASDRLGKRKLFIVAGSALMSLAFIAVSLNSGPLLLASIIALGISSAMIPPNIQTLPSEILEPSLANVGFGVMTITGNIGPILAPPLVGYILDATNSFFYTIATLSIIAVAGTVVGIYLKTR